ncbi:type I-E CRISPR-associated protein Cas5/CasD, partial [Escherichia coli]
MRSYLILRLAGPMQAWGQPTFEGTRPTGRFPTRSGLLGLLGACLGIQRDDTSSLQALSESVQFAVRCDELILDDRRVSVTGLRDYHTVNRPGFPGECFICELRLPDHRFRWKHNKLFLLLPEEYGPAFP